jgi:hypothetical protein
MIEICKTGTETASRETLDKEMPLSSYLRVLFQRYSPGLALEPADRLEHEDLRPALQVLVARLHGLGHVLRLAVRLDGGQVLVPS